MTVETYKGYGIDFDVYGRDEYSVQYCGNDCMFDSLEAAREFIDKITLKGPEKDFLVKITWTVYRHFEAATEAEAIREAEQFGYDMDGYELMDVLTGADVTAQIEVVKG